MASLFAAGLLVGCSSDYLDVEPETVISAALVQTTQEGAQQALYGLCQTMYCPMGSFFDNYIFPNGEPYISTVYGDIMGQDYFSYMWASRTGGNFTWQANRMPGGWIPLIPWSYCYNLINQANMILQGIDNIHGDEAQLKLIKGQALTIRAHAYTRLVQLYAPRWQDSNNGEAYCCVVRLTPGIEDVPLSKMKDVIAQIYEDCDNAVLAYTESGARRGHGWEPDISVARGIKARAAMLREDWPEVQKMAHDARASYSIMTPEQYKSGFCDPNGEWMWYAYDESSFGYACFGTMYACNGAYPGVWGDGAGVINYELYRKFPEDDIRSDLFFTPDKLVGNRVKPAAFWNENWIQSASMDLNSLNDLMKAQIKAYLRDNTPAVAANWPKPYTNFQTGNDDETKVMFGAQLKFWCKNDYGSGNYCVMRAAEMLLAEAEAAYYNRDETTAVNNLKELNAQRNPNYTCNLSGEALLEEIRLQRRFELWGEGFNWFDLKRWNLPMERKAWEKNNIDSNNIPQAYKLIKEASDRGGKYAVPLNESRYNKLVDRTLVDE